MFTHPLIPDAVNLAQTALLALWALALFGGFALGTPAARNPQRIPRYARLGSSLLLVLAAWGWQMVFSALLAALPLAGDQVTTLALRGWVFQTCALWLAIGMTFGFIGDIFMARKNLPPGIAAFGLGHVAYIVAFLNVLGGFASALRPLDSGVLLLSVGVWWGVGVAGWGVTVYAPNRRALTPVHWAALPYTLLLCTTAGGALGLALQHAAFLPLALGGALFVLSDTLLSAGMFMGKKLPLHDDLVWLTYGPAQALIVSGVYAVVLALA